MKQAIYVYVPVVHSGVLSFLDAYPDTPIWLLDNEAGKEENVYLERDMRALPAAKIKIELEAHGYKEVQVVDQLMLQSLVHEVDELIVPNEEIVMDFLTRHAPGTRTIVATTFLRWTKQISTAEHIVPPDRQISHDALHTSFFSLLVEEAQKSSDWWRQVGAMLVRDGKSIAIDHNHHAPTAHSVFINGDPRSNLDAGQGPLIYTSIHAEAAVIAKAARAGISTKGCELFVTTFPCPACARLLVEAGVTKVFYQKGYSLLDAEEILKNAGVEIILVEETEV